jgi:hypothetical protein
MVEARRHCAIVAFLSKFSPPPMTIRRAEAA